MDKMLDAGFWMLSLKKEVMLILRPLKNVHFCSRSRTILQDSRIGQLLSCP